MKLDQAGFPSQKIKKKEKEKKEKKKSTKI